MLGAAAMRAASPPRRPLGRFSRGLGHRWRLLLAATVVAFLILFPGTVLLQLFAGVNSAALVSLLTTLAFAGLVLTLIAAHAHDHVRATTLDVDR